VTTAAEVPSHMEPELTGPREEEEEEEKEDGEAERD
jgi:hypothetical protein